MTPDKQQQLIDLLDKELDRGLIGSAQGAGGADVVSSAGDDPEAAKEQAILRVALEVIRFNALTREVKSVMKDVKAGETALKVVGHVPAGSIVSGAQIQAGNGAIIRKFSMSSRRIAAILVFAVCLGGAGKYLFTSPSGVFDTYYSSYTLGNTRGGEGLTALEKAYQDKDWSSVVHTFQFTRSKTGKDYFLTGMAYMEQKEYYEAIGLFKSLIASNEQSKEPYFQDEAEYYLAMSYLATHQTAPALTLLNKIRSDPHHLFNKQVSNMSGTDLLILRAK